MRLLSDPWRILVSEALDDADLTMAFARAIALWWLGRDASFAPEPGDVAALASEIAVPIDDLAWSVAEEGEDVEDLADAFVVPPDVMRDRLRSLSLGSHSGTYVRLVEAS